MGYVIGSGGGGLVDGSGGGSLGKGEVMGKVMKRDGGLVEAMGGCRPPTPAPAGWVRPYGGPGAGRLFLMSEGPL